LILALEILRSRAISVQTDFRFPYFSVITNFQLWHNQFF